LTEGGKKKLVTYGQWHQLLVKNFEKQYYVPMDKAQDKSYALDSSLVARRGIYKDVVGSGSSHLYADYQLRCNFPIAMAVAPELFDAKHAREALKVFYDVLWGPLGVATLDPQDPQYRPYYDNSNDSNDPAIAKGRK
jgi:glycogen debranching enzyme